MVVGIKDNLVNQDTEMIFGILGNHSNFVRFIGGSVRDSFICKKPKDIDIATIYTPIEVIEKLNKYNIKTMQTGIKFGTIGASLNGTLYEITTLRKDIDCDGRHAIVEFTDNWRLDAIRRDFTINAMSYSINGEIFDYHHGIDDLNNKIVKFIGNASERIVEDYLRILRFFRFSSYYANDLNLEALYSIAKYYHNLNKISGERIQAEMFKIISSPKAFKILQSMQDLSIFDVIGIDDDIDLSLFKNLKRAEELLNQTSINSRNIYMLGYKDLDKIIQRWKLPNKIKAELHFFKNNIVKNDASIKFIKNKLIDHGIETVKNILILSLAADLDSFKFFKNLIDLVDSFIIPTFPLTGKDLIKAGIEPGKNLGDLLNKAKKSWIDSNYESNKNDLIKLLL